MHNVEAGKDKQKYYGRAVEYTDNRTQSFHTYYDLENVMNKKGAGRCATPIPGVYVEDLLTKFHVPLPEDDKK
jgi:hypothetical protein